MAEALAYSSQLPWRRRIRTRLFAAFVLLFVLTLTVVVVGISGMRENQRTLDEFEASVMPDIARVLELAEKAAQLAAVAPSIADTDSPSLLENDTELMRSLLNEIHRLSSGLSSGTDEKLDASSMMEGIDRDLAQLVKLSSERRQYQRLLRMQRNRLDSIGDSIYRKRELIARQGPTLQAIWAIQVTATLADDDTVLGRTEGDAEALWVRAEERREAQRLPELAALLRELSQGELSVFELRRNLLLTERRINTVVQLTRSHADQLGVRASNYVADLRAVASQRRDAVRQAVRSGESSLLLLGGVSVLVALLAVAYVRRILGRLQAVTQVMARLASGDTKQAVPAIERSDEIGELARAFQVFRENLLDKQRLTLGLDTQRRLLETVFSSMNDGLSVYDAEGRLVTWNPKFATLLELPRDALEPGMSIAQIQHAMPIGWHWRSVSRDATTQSMDEQIRIASAAELHLADGRVLEFHSHPMPDGGWVAVCRDLTVRRAVESQLHQAQRLEVLGQLTGGVAHDFNNFLAAILGNLELLQKRLPEASDTVALASRARRAAERAAGLTRRLLAFARRQPLAPETVLVADMLAEMLDLVEYSVGAGIEITVEPAAEPVYVCVDRGQLENAVLNLALNSAAAMPQGGRLTLAVAQERYSSHVSPPGDAVVLRVRDTGHGIPAALKAKVLEPFFSTKAPGQGSGLGLSIIYGFVRQSGGDLVIQSEEDAGTTVELWLPAVAHSAAPPESAAPPVLPRYDARVLVVEDDTDVSLTVTALLEELRAKVVQAESEEAAMQALAEHGPFDLVLSDIMLGAGGDGVRLVQRIRQRWPAQRVVLASGLPLETHADRPDWPKGQDFIGKPYRSNDLAMLLAD